jgi:hypothetical protein
LINISEPEAETERSYWGLGFVGVFALLVAVFLHWGGYLVEASDSLPDHVEAAVVLQGPIASAKARMAAAMALLRQGSADRVAISIPKQSYWEEEVAPIARLYVEKNYGPELAGKVDFCETAAYGPSTEEEAREVGECIQEHHWKAIALVTSNYASRRVGMIWRKSLFQRDPSIHLSVDGVADPEYQPHGWWRQTLYVKTWVTEVTKLVRAIS